MNDLSASIVKPQLDSFDGEELASAIATAKTLLAYANESGVALDVDIITTIVESERSIVSGSISAADEVKFWQAYQVVARAVAPVTIASLQATSEAHDLASVTTVRWWQRSKSPARRAVRYNTALVILVLAVLLVVQVYQLFGASLTAEIRALASQQDAVLAKPTVAVSGPAAEAEAAQKAAALENIDLRKISSYSLLTWWNNCLPDWLAPVSIREKVTADTAMAKRLADQQRALLVLDVMQRYILPLLYGLLGSCVYVLRSLATQIRARTYTESSNIDIRLRIYIGALSGLIIGWFFSPESGGVLSTLSQNALAFLAGYSVDLLFSALDRILSAFAGSPAGKSEAARGYSVK